MFRNKPWDRGGGSQQQHPRFEPSDITQEMLDGAKDVIVKKREMKEEEVQTAASPW